MGRTKLGGHRRHGGRTRGGFAFDDQQFTTGRTRAAGALDSAFVDLYVIIGYSRNTLRRGYIARLGRDPGLLAGCAGTMAARAALASEE